MILRNQSMKMVGKILLLKTICIVTLIFQASCSNDSNASTINKNYHNKNEELQLNLTSFKYLPEEINKCNCLFSSDKTNFSKKKYILISDFIVTSYVSINGVLTKFIMMSYDYQNLNCSTAIYKSSGYDLKVEIMHTKKENKKNKGEKKGKITLTGKDGRSTVNYFYGECGCD